MVPTSKLSEIGERLSQLLRECPDHAAVRDTLDYVAGAFYSLVKMDTLPFWDRSGQTRPGYKDKVADYVAGMTAGKEPNVYWLSGYFLNSALQRIAAAYDRVPKLVLGILEKNTRSPHDLMKEVFGGNSNYPNWRDAYCEVNHFKHSATGRAEGRTVGKQQAIDALGEIVRLFDTKKDQVFKKYSG